MLKLQQVDAAYGKAKILDQLSLRVNAGQVVALLGRNGAGKSTTMKTIMGMVTANTGSIQFNDRDITRMATHEIARAGVGYVAEDRRIFPDLSVMENLEVGRRPARDELPEWTEEALFGLFPNLTERRDNGGKQLSGGEQQMLTIARTLMGNPLLLLLDEPSEGLAPRIVEQMALTIQQLKQRGLTILLSEQNLHFARLVADAVCIIEKGAVQFTGSLQELDADPPMRDSYLSV